MKYLPLLILIISASCTKKNDPVVTESSVTSQQEKTIVIIGDSLTEGYGVPKDKAFPFLVEEKFASKDQVIDIINSGISGSTSASAPERVKWALQSKPDVIVLALGANDGLRGLSPSLMKKNLKKSIDMAKEANVKVILFGMLVPPNFGKKYYKAYEDVFTELAQEEDVSLLPFLLKDVAGVRKLNQSDGIHPNEDGHQIIATTVFQFLEGEI